MASTIRCLLPGMCAAVLLLAPGCTLPRTTPTASGSLALSVDGSRLYVADADNNQLVVVDAAARKVLQTIAVGNEPSHVLTAPDGRVFVSNRQSRSVSVVDPVAGRELARIAVGTEPTGMAFTPDGRTLLVANTTNANVSVIDVATLQQTRIIPTDPDPYDITMLPGGHAYVTHTRAGTVSVVDLATGTVLRGINLGPTPDITSNQIRAPEGPVTPVISSTGRVYIPLSLAGTDGNLSPNLETVGYSGSVSATSVTPPVVVPAMATVDSATGTLLPGAGFAAVNNCNTEPPEVRTDVPPMTLLSLGTALSGPSAAVLDPHGVYVYVAHMNSNNVAIIATNPAKAPSPALNSDGLNALPQGVVTLVNVGAGPNGLAIPPTAAEAYVYNSFDHTISVIGPDAGRDKVIELTRFSVGATSLSPEQDLGRRLFYSASDPRMSTAAIGGVACASCHLQGREDGRTWQFPEGPRNTPTLAGRHLATTAPYHWDGGLSDMPAFSQVVTSRMGGTGAGLSDADFNAIGAFLDGQAPPDNPYRTATLSASAQRGQALFAGAAACITCHSGADYTDNLFHDVGTLVNQTVTGKPEAASFPHGLNTPSLRNVFISAPYLHDGSRATLRARIMDSPGNMHGNTSQLSSDQVDDLVAFLQTL
jgi:YVTN family beta-propeller protein